MVKLKIKLSEEQKKKLKKELKQSAKFIVAVIVVTVVLYYGLIFEVLGIQNIEHFTALVTQAMLKGVGVQSTVIANAEPVILQVQGISILISELCTGMLETILLFSAVISSFGIPARKRIFGAIGALVFGFAFNQLRIFVSIMQLLHESVQVAELTHDLMFRISIIIVIAGYYAVWFKWAASKGK